MHKNKNANVLLIISSSFFLLPSIYAFIKIIYPLSILSAITTLISVTYWICPTPGWRYNLDICFAKFSFFVYFLVGFIYIKDWSLLYILYPCALLMGLFYGMSIYFSLANPSSTIWKYFHFCFHVVVTCSQLLIIYGSFCLKKK